MYANETTKQTVIRRDTEAMIAAHRRSTTAVGVRHTSPVSTHSMQWNLKLSAIHATNVVR
jgi:hypothetical protein